MTLECRYNYYFPSAEPALKPREAGSFAKMEDRRCTCMLERRKIAVLDIELRETIGVTSVKLYRQD